MSNAMKQICAVLVVIVAVKCAEEFLRIGRGEGPRLTDQGFLRIGRGEGTKINEQGFLRIGRGEGAKVQDEGFLRIGRGEGARVNDQGFLRIGRGEGARVTDQGFLRIGRGEATRTNNQAFLRIGRGESQRVTDQGFLRIGRGEGSRTNDQGFLRIGRGKGHNNQGFLRIGRGEGPRVDDQGFLRIGRGERPKNHNNQGFLRIGRGEGPRVDDQAFLRIGRSLDMETNNADDDQEHIERSGRSAQTINTQDLLSVLSPEELELLLQNKDQLMRLLAQLGQANDSQRGDNLDGYFAFPRGGRSMSFYFPRMGRSGADVTTEDHCCREGIRSIFAMDKNALQMCPQDQSCCQGLQEKTELYKNIVITECAATDSNIDKLRDLMADHP